MTSKYLDYFIGTREKTDQGCIHKKGTEIGIIFDLVAFCDYKGARTKSRKYQTTTDYTHTMKLCLHVLGRKPTFYSENGSFNEACFKREMEEFKKCLAVKWFLFEDESKNENPAGINPKKCQVLEGMDSPDGDDWYDAIAIPKFGNLDEAKRDWFHTDRIQRSRLALVGDQLYYCNQNGRTPVPCDPNEGIDKSCYHEFEEIPYLVMKREAYEAICENSVASAQESVIESESVAKSESVTELEFIESLYETLKNNGRHFKKDDLKNFHVALKSGYLTILSGMSGTGKSSIVNAYADALGEENCKLLFIPVSPAWTSEYDLLGYYDDQSGQYIPRTELVKFLCEAQRHPNCLYLVCLDEMNLARVEHYFSSFLSVLERENEDDRKIILYCENNGRDSTDAESKDKIPGTLIIPSNVRFVGTVNIDDTTYNFADKVRDRANIINLEICNYSGLSFKKQTEKLKSNEKFSFLDHVKVYEDLDDSLEENLLDTLWQMHEALNHASSSFGISPRTVRAIGTYLANDPDAFDNGKPKDDVLDLQINQRVLTKVHGTEALVKSVLVALKTHMEGKNWSTCEASIEAKLKELEYYGYCS